jgi:hypothetical protein
MAAYVIADVKVSDPEQYKQYMALSPGAIAAPGAASSCAAAARDPGRALAAQPRRGPRVPQLRAAKAFYDVRRTARRAPSAPAPPQSFNMIIVEGV